MSELAQEPPLQIDGSGAVSVASWNICSVRNVGLEVALRVMASMNIDLRILQETKLTRNIYMWSSAGYCAVAMEAASASQRGVALFWRQSNLFEVVEVVKYGPNFITMQVVPEADQFHIVGCYIPPTIRQHGDESMHGINTQKVVIQYCWGI